jgi:hypothetical protein
MTHLMILSASNCSRIELFKNSKYPNAVKESNPRSIIGGIFGLLGAIVPRTIAVKELNPNAVKELLLFSKKMLPHRFYDCKTTDQSKAIY